MESVSKTYRSTVQRPIENETFAQRRFANAICRPVLNRMLFLITGTIAIAKLDKEMRFSYRSEGYDCSGPEPAGPGLDTKS